MRGLRRHAGRYLPIGLYTRIAQSNPADARKGQIAALASLLTFGVATGRLSIGMGGMVATFLGAWITHLLTERGNRRLDPLSPTITAFSLCLLLRTSAPWMSPLAAALAIGSKRLLNIDGRHIWNPANFGLIAATILSDSVWISPGQWGTSAPFVITAAGVGAMIVTLAGRGDTVAAFLGSYALLMLGRGYWLGDPMAVSLHRLSSGALYVFAFFMISDPRTTPRRRDMRVVFAAVVAAVGFALQFSTYNAAGVLWALFFCAPLVPALDWMSDRINDGDGRTASVRNPVGAPDVARPSVARSSPPASSTVFFGRFSSQHLFPAPESVRPRSSHCATAHEPTTMESSPYSTKEFSS